MADRPDITLDDLKTLARGQAPDLAQAIIHFAAQPQPVPDNVPQGAITADAFEQMLKDAQQEYRESVKRMKVALLWRRYLTQPDPPPAGRYLLADFLLEIYLAGGEPNRASLLEVARSAPLARGLWGGLKRSTKRPEYPFPASSPRPQATFSALSASLANTTSPSPPTINRRRPLPSPGR